MFWKKKQTPGDLEVETTTNQREAFRYKPPEAGLIHMSFMNKKVSVVNISAGGIAFTSPDFSTGDQGLAVLTLSDPDLPEGARLELEMKILSMDETGVCRAEFVNPEAETQELIHRFLWIKQKQELKERKNRDSSR